MGFKLFDLLSNVSCYHAYQWDGICSQGKSLTAAEKGTTEKSLYHFGYQRTKTVNVQYYHIHT